MSLVTTLAKVAAGVVVANSVKNMIGGGASGRSLPRTGRVGQASAGGGLEDILGQVLGGGGLPGGMGGTSRSRSSGSSSGGIQDMLGQILGGAAGGAGAGSMGGILDQLSQMSRPGGGSSGGAGQGSFGTMLDQALNNFGAPAQQPSAQDEALAGVLLKAMIQAAKADGRIDPKEKQHLLGQLGDVSPDEMRFVEAELNRPTDAAALAREVPRGAEQQVYMVSLMAIELDDQSEARYLAELAQALNLNAATANAIHDKLGAPRIFR